MAQPATNPKIEELRFRLKTDPKSRLFYQLAEELRRAGQFSEAESVLRNGLTSYPTYLAAWVSLGRVLREQKNDTDAVDALTKALQLDPGNMVAARLLADAYLALGEKIEAVKKYKLVYALLPADEELRLVIEQLDREVAPPPPPMAIAPPPVEEELAVAPPEEAAAPVFEEEAFAAPEAPAFEEEAFAAPEAPAFEEEAFAAPEAPAFEEEAFAAAAPVVDEEPAIDATAPVIEEEVVAAPAPTAEQLEDSPFDRTMPPFDEAARSLEEEIRVETETADVEPMAREHEDSPFEEPVAGFTSAAMEIEAPLGMQIVSAPMSADVASYVDEELPTVDSTPVFDTTPPLTAVSSDDAGNTLTMADLYVRQGLLEDARHIYENILARDPDNADVRQKLASISPRVNEKVVILERWLAKVSKREVGRV